MNIRDALLEVHSKEQAYRIADYVGADPERFAELIKLLTGPVYRLSQRAAWPVGVCIERNPNLIKPYFKLFIEQLEREDAHVAVRRNVARLLQFVEIPKRYAGRLFDVCCSLVDNPKETIAVRVFAMTVAANIARNAPELHDELRLLVAGHSRTGSAGFRSRSRRLLGV
jgi:hypothetical protein